MLLNQNVGCVGGFLLGIFLTLLHFVLLTASWVSEIQCQCAPQVQHPQL